MKKLLFFLFFTPLYPQNIVFFPEIIQTNPINNYGIIFITERLFTEKKYFVVHQGKEGFYLKLRDPFRFKNQIFSVLGKCTIIEGSFRLFLVIKNHQNKVINIPTENKFLTESNRNPYELIFKESIIIKYLKQSSQKSPIQEILNIELIGFLIHPFSIRTVFYCEEFSISTSTIFLDAL